MYTGLSDMTLEIQGLIPGLVDSGLIVVDPNTGMPASGPGAELSAEELAAQQAAARSYLATGVDCSQESILPDPRCQNSILTWLQQNKSAVYLGAGALFLMAIMKGGRR